jgi:aryl-alcohol dehydrogenase-like predicted oxidoreductase
MRRRRFGRTGWDVSPIGLGTYHLTSDRGVPRAEAVAVLRRAMALGVNLVDTAPRYGLGEAELIVRQALREFVGRYVLVDKVGRFERSMLERVGEAAYGDPDLIRRQFENSLELLGRDTLELLLVHEADWPQWWGEEDPASAAVTRALGAIRREGLAQRIGLSLRDPGAAVRLCDTGLFDAVLYVHYFNVVWQEAGDTVFAAAAGQDMGVAVGAPYRQGLLIDGSEESIRRLQARRPGDLAPGMAERVRRARTVAAEAGMTLAEMNLRFILSHPSVHVVLVGPRSVQELEENVEWADRGPLPADVLAATAALRDVPPEWTASAPASRRAREPR